MNPIKIIDDALVRPHYYQEAALRMPFQTQTFSPTEVFHGIAVSHTEDQLCARIMRDFHHLTPTLSFFRKSPAGQVEPTFIHSDTMMGDWTAILYLNLHPAPGDGTVFWMRKTDFRHHASLEELPAFAEDMKQQQRWREWSRVDAKFNRLMMFPSHYFHSRAIEQNYGQEDEARLIQVVFGKGQL